ncbi:MAG: DUF433 domain-containing protein [Thermoplasmata archaeon]|nr:DUF433 domain-containing protein [Thermoplasmata archaeon]
MLEVVMMLDRIEVNPDILSGKAVIRGTRIPVYLILELLSADYDFNKIIKTYPSLTKQDIEAAIAYAASLTKNDEVVVYGSSKRTKVSG